MENRRAEIIEAALKVVCAGGLRELTTKRLAAEVGLSEAALYRYFASKADIVIAIAGEVERCRDDIFVEAELRGESAAVALDLFFAAHVRHFIARPQLTGVFFSEDLFCASEDLNHRMLGMMRGTIYRISAVINAGQKAGLFRKTVQAEQAALGLIGGFRFLLTQWRMDGMTGDLAAETSVFVKSFLKLMQE